MATSGVVPSTLIDADYRLIVLMDCCVDLDLDLHHALLDKLFPKRAQVLTGESLSQLDSRASIRSRISAGTYTHVHRHCRSDAPQYGHRLVSAAALV